MNKVINLNKIIINKKVVGTLFVLGLLLLATCTIAVKEVSAAPWSGLGTAANFAVFATSTITSTGATTITGDLGLTGTSVTGFPPGTINGAEYIADSTATTAFTVLTNAFDSASGQTVTESPVSSVGGGETLYPGVYTTAGSGGDTLLLTGNLYLDGNGNPNSVFIFQIGSGLTTASGSHVFYTDDTQPCNVIWEVGSSATLGAGSTFVGTILAGISIDATSGGVTVDGRLIALDGAVTLVNDSINNTTGQLFVAPESALGTLMAVGVGFAAFGIVKMKQAKHLKR